MPANPASSPKTLLLSSSKIQNRVSEIGNELNQLFADKNPIIIGVLNGAFMFVSDLAKTLRVPVEFDFMKASSYGTQQQSSGSVTVDILPRTTLTHRHIIVVEDIIESSLTITAILDTLKAESPKSITTVSLLLKPINTHTSFVPDIVGFTIPEKFVVGYGLDHAGYGRETPDIYTLSE